MVTLYKRNCDYCGRDYIGRGKYFCSNKCSGLARPNVGCDDGNGRIVFRKKGRLIRRSNLVWIQHNQMPVPNGYVVHHINLICNDDRIENLILLPVGIHTSLHQTIKRGYAKDWSGQKQKCHYIKKDGTLAEYIYYYPNRERYKK